MTHILIFEQNHTQYYHTLIEKYISDIKKKNIQKEIKA